MNKLLIITTGGTIDKIYFDDMSDYQIGDPARFRDSDAVFNIGCAVGAVQTLAPGAWIAMSGCIWDPHEVRKNRDKNRFEAS